MSTNTTATECKRCNGTGNLPHFWFSERGKCFACNGRGTRDFAAERAAKADHAARLRLAEAIPAEADVLAAIRAGAPEASKMHTRRLAASWRNVALAEVWGETIDDPEALVLAAEADRILALTS